MKKIAVFFVLICSVFFTFSQEDEQDALLIEQMQRTSLAMSNPDYMVTAGDVYQLAYAAGTTPVNYPIIIDTTYKMRVANLSVIDVYGKTFPEVKALVEQIITRNYPMSGLQFTLEKPASFKVTVDGEVIRASEVSAWALSRLSTLAVPYFTPYSSLRSVTVTSKSGKKREYDLFLSQRYGDLSQDPYIRPGDRITVNRAQRKVSIHGAVERPGTYELLEGEHLKELIEVYASGLTLFADTSRIELIRYKDSDNKQGNKLFLTASDIALNKNLNAYDSVSIKANQDLNPVMFIEGAVNTGFEEGESTSPDTSSRLVKSFIEGENYGSLIRRYRSIFSAVSDTQNAYIIRNGRTIPININQILFDVDYYTNELVIKDDTLVIPFRQYFITVSGAVLNPGRYPYIPDRSWEYYTALAGGIDKDKNSKDAISITTIRGETLTVNDAITPESIIYVKTNSFLYFFNQYAPIITTILSIVSTVFTVMAVTKTTPL